MKSDLVCPDFLEERKTDIPGRHLEVPCRNRFLHSSRWLTSSADRNPRTCEFSLSPTARYVRIGYPVDTVPGSWLDSSRNSKLSGEDPDVEEENDLEVNK